MVESEPTGRRHAGRSRLNREAVVALLLLLSGCNQEDRQSAQTPAAQPAVQAPAAPPAAPQTPPQPATTPVQPIAPPPSAKPLTSLESLVAPVALYPDPLLAEVLVASTYPLEVVQAARWLDTRPDLATLNGKDWDASIMRLVSVPQVLKMMNDHLDWTTQLGDAFLAKPAELMDTIQTLRKRATDAGFLKDTPEQKVTAKTISATQPVQAGMDVSGPGGEAPMAKATPAVVKKEVISIAPAQADTVYVPQYNPATVYQAPMAPPPATAPAYYPAYYPPPATTTSTSTTDSWLTFGAGAVVGGLLTWGIMEWADHDDDYYHGGYYPVGHYYGGAVCNNGNCWHGGGYYGDRGDINYNKNVNVSGNEINVDRGGVFSQNNLRPAQQPAGWRSDPQHRRGQAYPEAVQQRLGRAEQPALAGQRLGSAQTLPAPARGFADAAGRPSAGTLPAERRPSSADIQQRLAQKPGAGERPGQKFAQPQATARDIQGRTGAGARESALNGLRESGKNMQIESRRGAESRQPAASRSFETPGRPSLQRPQLERPRPAATESRPRITEQRAEVPRQVERRDAYGGRQSLQQRDLQRRPEGSRPNAFDGARDAGATRDFSQRGAFSRGQAAGGSRANFGGGGGRFSGGGAGGGGRFGGGGGGGRRR